MPLHSLLSVQVSLNFLYTKHGLPLKLQKENRCNPCPRGAYHLTGEIDL